LWCREVLFGLCFGLLSHLFLIQPDVLLAPFSGQSHLMLSLTELFSPLGAGFSYTVGTTDTVLKIWAG
jgi:hypothetical protein